MAGRGRGAGSRGGMLKGATWDYDPEAKIESTPSETYPVHPNIKKPRPLTAKEKRVVRNYKSIQDATHLGPKYTQSTKRKLTESKKTFGEVQFNNQYGGRGKADIDPFTAVETYSQKYDPPKRTLPDLSKITFDKTMFPEELWGTLEGKEGLEVKKHIGRAMEKKAALMEALKNGAKKTGARGDKSNDISAKIDALGIVEDEGPEEEGEDEEEEEKDDDYEEDEEGGDYDAEQYFDDGAEDEDEGGDGGEDY